MNVMQVQPWVESFSSRELEIIHLVSDGLSNREIAQKLHLSIETIKWYNKQVFMKLGVKNRTQAANKAEELKLLEKDQTPSAKAKRGKLGNLPVTLSSYVGREKEIEEIKDLLKHNRLVTLTGAGGSGKTRLALQVAEELQENYRDGVWLVEMANIRDQSQIVEAIAIALNITDKSNETLSEVLKHILSRKHLLLLIDNLEHLLDSVPLISDLLAAAPQLSVLGTSRERLHIYGEQEYSVHPLRLPEPTSNSNSEELKTVEAIALFIERARAVHPNIPLDGKTLEDIARICEWLDGLPLAIELCAPLVKVFPPAMIAERIEKNLGAIPPGPRDLPARQQTLIKTIQWSYDLLKEDEKRLFERMSVFSGGGTLEAIESICGEGISDDIGNILTALVNKNLVLAQERRDGQIHFGLLETIRQFHQERLATTGELAFLLKLHAKYFTQLAEKAHDEFSSQKHKYWFLHLKAEKDNFRSAMNYALQASKPDMGLRLAAALHEYWNYYGFAREALRWNEQALEKSDGAIPALKAAALKATGNLYINFNEFEQGKSVLNQALPIFRKLNDEQNEARTMVLLGMSDIGQPEIPAQAIELIQKGFEVLKQNHNLGGMAHTLNILGEMYRVQGNIKNAKSCYQESLELSQECGDLVREAIQYANLGLIAYEEKEFQLAEQHIKQALACFLELDASYGKSYHLAMLAGPYLALGKPLRAARILGASVAGMESLESVFQLADKSTLDSFSKETYKALDEQDFRKAYEEGQRMSIEEAVIYALSNTDETG